MLTLAASRVGNLANNDSLSQALGISSTTGRRYFELLEQAYLAFTLPAWSRNLGQRLVKSPKVYLVDSGLVCHLLNYNAQRICDDTTSFPGPGAIFENFVALELIKQAGWADTDCRFHHYRSSSGAEVDLIAERRDGGIVGVECKLATTADIGDFKHLIALRDKLDDHFKCGILAYTGSSTVAFGDRLWAVPAAALWRGRES